MEVRLKIIKCNNIDEVRTQIDLIDNELVRLISQRSVYVKQAAKFKKDTESVKAPARIELVIEKVRNLSKDYDIDPDIIETIYRIMIGKFVDMEMKEFNK